MENESIYLGYDGQIPTKPSFDTVAEHIEKIRTDLWLGYPQAVKVIDKMEKAFIEPNPQEKPWLLILGDINNGKTTIGRRFLHLHPVDLNLNGDSMIAQVIMVEAPELPEEEHFYENIFRRLFIPYKKGEPLQNKRARVIKFLTAMKVRLMILDNIQFILSANERKKFSEEFFSHYADVNIKQYED